MTTDSNLMKNKFIQITITLFGIIVVIFVTNVFIRSVYYDLFFKNSEPKKDMTKAEEDIYWIKGKGVRLREKPSVSAKIIATLQGGNTVLILERIEPEIVIKGTKGKWAKVQVQYGSHDSKIGFIFDAYLVGIEDSPFFRYERAMALEKSDIDSALKIYESILKDFPDDKAWGPDMESNRTVKSIIENLKCWKTKTQQGFASEELLLEELKLLTTNKNRKKLKDISHCEFLMLKDSCAGDFLPYPVNDKALTFYFQWTSDSDWNTLKDKCVKSIDGKNFFCFFSYEYNNKFYWAGGCYNDPEFLPK